MEPFDFQLLIGPASAIFLVTLLATYFATGLITITILFAVVKVGIFLIYFGVFFNGTYTFWDDWSYLDIGRLVHSMNFGISDVLDNVDLLSEMADGSHFVYYIYNAYAIGIFGDGYFAPVAMNIILTVPMALLGSRLAAKEFNFDDRWTRIFFGFLLFHPDILVWSSISNGKDTLVLLAHVCLLASVSIFMRRNFVLSLALAVPTLVLLSYLRFYVPLFFATALALSQIPTSIRNINWFQLVVGSLTLIFSVGFIGTTAIDALRADVLSAGSLNPFYGFFHFILTPVPFGTAAEYAFLDIPALMHWLMIPFAVSGLLYVVKLQSNYGRFFLLYLVVFTFLYATVEELRGPRQRVQLDYAWAVLQFLGLRKFSIFKIFGASRQNIPKQA